MLVNVIHAAAIKKPYLNHTKTIGNQYNHLLDGSVGAKATLFPS